MALDAFYHATKRHFLRIIIPLGKEKVGVREVRYIYLARTRDPEQREGGGASPSIQHHWKIRSFFVWIINFVFVYSWTKDVVLARVPMFPPTGNDTVGVVGTMGWGGNGGIKGRRWWAGMGGGSN